MTTFLLILHGLVAVALLGASTHQAMSCWWPVRSAGASFLARFRAVKAANYVNAIIILYVVTFALGAWIYPNYRIVVRPVLEDLHIGAGNGAFEFKEHIEAIGLGLLPAYRHFWRVPLVPEHHTTRRALALILALFVWSGFLIGHVLNNIRGL